ncbi:hypothetical protein HN51_054452 [Arachis hypogaea]
MEYRAFKSSNVFCTGLAFVPKEERGIEMEKEEDDDILKEPPSENLEVLRSPYLSLPLVNTVKIARECGWKTNELTQCLDPCAVCLEKKCTVAVEGPLILK